MYITNLSKGTYPPVYCMFNLKGKAKHESARKHILGGVKGTGFMYLWLHPAYSNLTGIKLKPAVYNISIFL